jgi:protein transport protein HofC
MQSFLEWITGPFWQLLFSRAQAARQATLLWTLAVAVEKHVALVPFLEALADEAGGRWRWKLRGLAELLNAGVSIPDALDSIDGVLPADTRLLIRVGAETGRIGPALRDAAMQVSRRSEATRPPGGSGLLYLCGLGFVMFTVVGFIMYWIVPKFKAIFEGFNLPLPAMTEWIIWGADFVLVYFFLLGPLTLVMFLLATTVSFEMMGWGSGSSGRARWMTRFFPRLQAPLVLRSLSMAVDGARPLEKVISTISAGHPDRSLRRRMAAVEEQVSLGHGCWHSMMALGMLRGNEILLLDAAERVGNLAWALRGIADSIERRTDHRMRIAVELLRPVGLLIAGTVVGLFVVGMFLPLVELIMNYPLDGGAG